MDLLIQNATLEQITTICSRIAAPSFDEMMDDSRLEEISKYINNGDSVSNAKQKWQEDLVDKAEDALTNSDGTKRITREEIKREMGFQNNNAAPEPEVKTEIKQIKDKTSGNDELHLDGPPPEDAVTLGSVIKLATDVAKAGKMDCVRALVKEFGVKKVKQLKPEDLEPAYKKLSEALNG